MASLAWEQLPDERGWFGEFGGRFVPETLMHPLEELNEAFEAAVRDRISKPNWMPSCAITQGDRHRSISPAASPNIAAGQRFTSSAKICCTQAPTKSTTPSVKPC